MAIAPAVGQELSPVNEIWESLTDAMFQSRDMFVGVVDRGLRL